MSYVLRIDKKAAKTLKTLDQLTTRRLLARITELSSNPYDQRTSSSLEMQPSVRKSRVGNWRIFFEVDDTELIIDIVAIKPRSRAYR
ncbi:MAG: type II toxin-antitoxin system RelE family toxin [Thermodesulfobacteriota bacterium]